MTSTDFRADPPPLPPSQRKAAFWAWPVILASVFFIGWSVNLFSPGDRDESGNSTKAGHPAAGAPKAGTAADLALLKIQSQVVIAVNAVSPKDAADSIEELKKLGGSDSALASIALLESFIGLKEFDPEATVDRISEEAPGELRELVAKAISEGVSEEERATLDAYVGWFSKLAQQTGPGPAPDAAGIRNKATIVMVVAVGAVMGALFAVLVGAILLFILWTRHNGRSDVVSFRRFEGPRGVMLECFAIYLGIMALGEILGVLALHSGGVLRELLSVPAFTYFVYGSAVVVPFLWPFVRGIRWKDFLRSLGFHCGRGVFRELGAGVVGYTGVLAVASIGIGLTLLLSWLVGFYGTLQSDPGSGMDAGTVQAPAGPTTHPIVGWIYSGGWRERVLCLLLAAGFAPFFEEIFFRGAFQRYLRGRFRFLSSALIGGLLFAALHPQGWMGIPALTAMGVGFSLLREWRDSLIAPMTAHAINNGVLVAILCIAL